MGGYTGLKGRVLCQSVICLIYINFMSKSGNSTTSKKKKKKKKLNQKYESGLNIDFR
jgi:hypothetical protein